MTRAGSGGVLVDVVEVDLKISKPLARILERGRVDGKGVKESVYSPSCLTSTTVLLKARPVIVPRSRLVFDLTWGGPRRFSAVDAGRTIPQVVVVRRWRGGGEEMGEGG